GHRGQRGHGAASPRFQPPLLRASCPRFGRKPGTETGDTPREEAVTVHELLSRLERVSKTHSGWMARCPAHEDSKPSLSVAAAEDGRVLLRCFAGCELAAIVGALQIEVRDLFTEPAQGVSTPGEPVPARQVPS